MNENTCETCAHFRLHYVRRGKNWYMPLREGHCVRPRLKPRKAEAPACPRWCLRRGAPPDESVR